MIKANPIPIYFFKMVTLKIDQVLNYFFRQDYIFS